jgi:hypothetical protein
MTVSEGVREVTGEMIRLQHLLRQTSPSHNLSEEERKLFLESVERAEQALKRVAAEVKPR